MKTGRSSRGFSFSSARPGCAADLLEKRDNIVDYWNVVIRWFETYLRKK